MEKLDKENRVVYKSEENEFSKTEIYYVYLGEETEPSTIKTVWDDYSHKVKQVHEEEYDTVGSNRELVSERTTYYDDKGNEIDYYRYEYFYDKIGRLVMTQEQHNEIYTTTINGFKVESLMGERLATVNF